MAHRNGIVAIVSAFSAISAIFGYGLGHYLPLSFGTGTTTASVATAESKATTVYFSAPTEATVITAILPTKTTVNITTAIPLAVAPPLLAYDGPNLYLLLLLLFALLPFVFIILVAFLWIYSVINNRVARLLPRSVGAIWRNYSGAAMLVGVADYLLITHVLPPEFAEHPYRQLTVTALSLILALVLAWSEGFHDPQSLIELRAKDTLRQLDETKQELNDTMKKLSKALASSNELFQRTMDTIEVAKGHRAAKVQAQGELRALDAKVDALEAALEAERTANKELRRDVKVLEHDKEQLMAALLQYQAMVHEANEKLEARTAETNAHRYKLMHQSCEFQSAMAVMHGTTIQALQQYEDLKVQADADAKALKEALRELADIRTRYGTREGDEKRTLFQIVGNMKQDRNAANHRWISMK
jgi:hypothetical protein